MKTGVNRVDANMTVFPSTAARGALVSEAYKFMMEMEIRHFPVVVSEVSGVRKEAEFKNWSVERLMVANPWSEAIVKVGI